MIISRVKYQKKNNIPGARDASHLEPLLLLLLPLSDKVVAVVFSIRQRVVITRMVLMVVLRVVMVRVVPQ